jgi:DmsE family decaheme c-type cytochrome
MSNPGHSFQKLLRAMALAAFAAMSLPVAAADKPSDTASADKGVVLRGDEKCMACHSAVKADEVMPIGLTRHGVKADARTPTCTSCHGASDKHMGSGGNESPDRVFKGKNKSESHALNGACLTCHEGGNRTLWHGSRHQNEDLACANCHKVHTQRDPVLTKATQPEVCFACHKTERAQIQRISTHPIAAGKLACSDCHSPHGSNGPKLLAKNSTNETCFTCHAEKRGPFLWEHPSVSDDCMNCHTPHGSTNPPLLKARAPYLCQECHGDGAPHPGNVYSASSLPGGAAANANNTGGVSGNNQLGVVNPITGARVTQNSPPPQLAFRACLDCHTQVHGSNHPAGNRFLR